MRFAISDPGGLLDQCSYNALTSIPRDIRIWDIEAINAVRLPLYALLECELSDTFAGAVGATKEYE